MEVSGDAAVISLGLRGRRPGRTYLAIRDSAKDLQGFLLFDQKLGEVKVGDIFLSEGFGTPWPHLIWAVVPFADQDPGGYYFRDFLEQIFDLCIKSGFRSVVMPFLGTGGNNYRALEVKNLIVKAGQGRSSRLEVRLANLYYVKATSDEFMTYLKDQGAFYRSLEMEAPAPSSTKEGSAFRQSAWVDGDQVRTVGQYIDSYLKERYQNDDISIKKVLKNIPYFLGYYKSRKTGDNLWGRYRDPLPNPPIKPDKKQAFLIAGACDMNTRESQEFLRFCGRDLGPDTLEDKLMMFFLANNLFDKGLYPPSDLDSDEDPRFMELEDLFIRYTGKSFFGEYHREKR